MDPKKLERMQAQVRIGGKGTARRKKKIAYKTDTIADNKLQAAMQKIRVNEIPSVEEVNLFKDDGSIMHFENPRVKASFYSNMFALYGHCEDKQITEPTPGIIGQMGPEAMSGLAELPRTMDCTNNTDDDNDWIYIRIYCKIDFKKNRKICIRSRDSQVLSGESGPAQPAQAVSCIQHPADSH